MSDAMVAFAQLRGRPTTGRPQRRPIPGRVCRRSSGLDGKENDGRFAVGMPVQEPDQASCLAVIDGLPTPACPINGHDTVQALRSALQHIAWELYAFVERGGRVVELDSDDDVDLRSIFGRLWAPTPS